MPIMTNRIPDRISRNSNMSAARPIRMRIRIAFFFMESSFNSLKYQFLAKCLHSLVCDFFHVQAFAGIGSDVEDVNPGGEGG